MIGENSEGRGREREREEGTTSWSWYLFNFLLQDSIFSGKPTRHMFEFSFLNCKVKNMLFWTVSPNICLVFSAHLLCRSRSTSKSCLLLLPCRLSAECRLVFLKDHQEDGISGLGKNNRIDLGRRLQKIWGAKEKRQDARVRGCCLPWTHCVTLDKSFPSRPISLFVERTDRHLKS